MLAWVCAIGMVGLALLGGTSIRRAPDAQRGRTGESFPIDLPLTLGVALGILGSSVRENMHPWIAGAGPVSIPIGAGAIGVGWALIRNDTTTFRLRVSDAIGLVLSWIVLVGALLSGGLGLAESAAALLGLAAWSVLGSPGGPPVPRHIAWHRLTGAIWGVSLLGLAGMLLGLPPRVPWAIAGAMVVVLAMRSGPHHGPTRLGSCMAILVVTPLAALATASAARVVMGAAASGDSMVRMGESWFIGFAHALGSRPVARLPAGFTPEVCVIAAALGVGICASKLPRGAHRLLGGAVALAGCGIGVLALVS